jgi:hypothetical protein
VTLVTAKEVRPGILGALPAFAAANSCSCCAGDICGAMRRRDGSARVDDHVVYGWLRRPGRSQEVRYPPCLPRTNREEVKFFAYMGDARSDAELRGIRTAAVHLARRTNSMFAAGEEFCHI